MRVVLDNEVIELPPIVPSAANADVRGRASTQTVAQTLAHAVQQAKQRAASRGRVIIEAHRAGQLIDIEALAAELDAPADPAGARPEADEIVLTSAEPRAVQPPPSLFATRTESKSKPTSSGAAGSGVFTASMRR